MKLFFSCNTDTCISYLLVSHQHAILQASCSCEFAVFTLHYINDPFYFSQAIAITCCCFLAVTHRQRIFHSWTALNSEALYANISKKEEKTRKQQAISVLCRQEGDIWLIRQPACECKCWEHRHEWRSLLHSGQTQRCATYTALLARGPSSQTDVKLEAAKSDM